MSHSSLALALLLACAQQQGPPPQTYVPYRPDVVVFFLDDVGARTVELMRAAGRLPAIDQLALQGTEFRNGYAQPMCAPSRWSIMQGTWLGMNAGFACHPNTDGTGPGAETRTLSAGVDSLPKAMEGAGYSTALFGRWAVGTWQNSQPGTQDYAYTPMLWGFETWRAGIPDGSEACGGSGYSDWLRVEDGLVSYSTEYHTTALVDSFVDWWSSTSGPRFAFVSFQAAHDPFHWPPASAMRPGWVQPSPATTRKQYESMIESADYALEQMLAGVDLENTLVLLLGDNGDPQAVPPNGYTANKVKFSTYDGGIRVPFIAAGLGFPSGQTSGQPVSEVDLIATLSAAAGVCVPMTDGQSILPALDGIPLERSWIYSQKGDGSKAVVEELWKLRQQPNGVQFLYDRQADFFESNPIDPDAPGYEDITARLRAALNEAQ